MRSRFTWMIVAALAIVALAAGVDALRSKDGPSPAEASATVAGPSSTPAPSTTSTRTNPTDTLAPDFTHVSAADAARFNAAQRQLQAELDAIVACFDVGGRRTACVNYHRFGLRADLRAIMQVWNTIGPQTRSNRCCRWLVGYGRLLTNLRAGSEALFAAAESGDDSKLRDVESKIAAGAHQNALARFLAVCVRT